MVGSQENEFAGAEEVDAVGLMNLNARVVGPERGWYLARVAEAGHYPHFSRWAADPARHDSPPQTFEQVLEWLLDGLQTLAGPVG